ncbi:MAG: 4Fe-4S binding protein [Firmicutes bacterium]|nr:4Fe-4S binding protein [Bacillota bacterium]
MILYFTGTGNSRYAAKVIGRAQGEELISMGELMKKGEYPVFHSETPYIIVSPVYGWRLPHVVADFMRKCRFEGCKDVYFILTCGDSIGDAGRYAKALCETVGLTYRGMADVVMPENYITLFKAPSAEEEKKIMAQADQRLQQIVTEMQAVMADDTGMAMLNQKGAKHGLLSRIVNPCFYRLFVKGEPYWVKESCISCGRCADLCPMNTIRIEEGKPVWGAGCTQCMACIAGCPVEAIEYGKKSLGKRRYMCRD